MVRIDHRGDQFTLCAIARGLSAQRHVYRCRDFLPQSFYLRRYGYVLDVGHAVATIATEANEGLLTGGDIPLREGKTIGLL